MNNWGTHQCRARHAPPFGSAEILWAEAFSTVTYIRNRMLTKALDPANLRACGAPCAIVALSEKLKKCAWAVGWATSISGAHVISAQCTYMEVVWRSWPIVGEVLEF